MTLREALRIEIWSKQTSRKILRVFGVVTGTAVLIFVAGYLVEQNWITPSEKTAARQALEDVESLKQKSNSGSDYEKQKEKADAAVHKARDAAWTSRDDRIAVGLEAYLLMVEMDKEGESRLAVMRKSYYATHPEAEEQDKQVADFSRQVREMTSQRLHQVLD